jgi:putative tricarboxylic transport membrane protein
MAQKGEAGKALGTGIVYSFIGGTLGLLALLFIAPLLADVGLKFGVLEYFAITLFSLTLLANLSSGSVLKGLASGVMGILISCVGFADDGLKRYTFGNYHLFGGFALVTYCIGFYAFYEVVRHTRVYSTISNKDLQDFNIRGFGFSRKEFKEQFLNMLRSACIGIGIGILPGLGGNISNFVSYSAAKSASKHPEKFGTGIMDGIVASETANNATIGGAQIPLLTLGIPGDSCGAFVLSAFMLHGVTPNPTMWQTDGDLIYSILFSLIIANFVMVILEFFGIRLFVRVLAIRKYFLLTLIMVMCIIGAYGTNNLMFDVYCVFGFGILGIIMRTLGFPLTPFVLGSILGSMVETNLRRSLMLTKGDFWKFFTSPLANVFMFLTIASIGWSIYKEYEAFKKRTARERVGEACE